MSVAPSTPGPARAEKAPRPAVPEKTHEVASHKSPLPLTTCRLDPTGRYAFAGAEDFHLHRWDLETGQETILEGNRSWVRSIDVSPDGQTVVSADWNGTVCWWPTTAAESKPIRVAKTHRGSCRWIRFSPDGSKLATCGNDNLVKLWTADGEPLAEMPGHKRHPYAIAFHPLREELASEDLVGVVKTWDTTEHRETRQVTLAVMTGYDKTFVADMGGARDMTFNADGSRLACAGITNVRNAFAGVQDPIVVVVDWATNKQLQKFHAASNFQGVAWGVRFHADGFLFACGAQQSGRGAIWFWRDGQEQPFHTVELKSAARGLDLLPDGRTFVVAHADGTLRLYSMTNA